MQNQPHFKYCHASSSNKHVASIKVEGKVIHEISNLDEFYKSFGYTQDMRMAGGLPDEVFLGEYINNKAAKFSACCQMHIVEYLRKYSDTFNKEYGNQFESWLASHAEVRAKRGIACAACRMK